MTDDIVDDENTTTQNKLTSLNLWRKELSKAFENNSESDFFLELKEYVDEFNIPHKPFFDLIEGMEIDLKKNRFKDFEELKDYCYKVASTVGLMTIPIFGYKNENTVKYAINLGIALQLTNIIRDIKTDSFRNRIYIPLEDLEKYFYSEEDLFNQLYNQEFVNLMKFQAERAREFYLNADRFLTDEDKPSMFTARAMQYIYFRLLDKIEQEDFNIFNRKIRVSTFNKIFIAFTVWLKYKIL